MASKLTSQAPCIHRSNEGSLEWGGVGAKDGCEKSGWDAGRYGEAWLNGFFCDDSLFASNCSSGAMHIEAPPSLYKRDHSEFDWLSKEMAFQEFILSDRPTPWFDLDTIISDLFKEEHDADIVSTLTAVAALFRDWCIVEKGFTESAISEKGSNFDGGYKNHVYFSDTLFGSGKEAELLTSLLEQSDGSRKSSSDFSLERVLKECYKNHLTQSGSSGTEFGRDSAQAFGTKSYEGDGYAFERSNLQDCPRSRSEEETDIYEHILHFNSKPLESKDDFMHAVVTKEKFPAAGTGLYTGMDVCAIFGKQISAASRFSFGRDSSGMSLANAEMLEPLGVSHKPEVSENSSGSNQNKVLSLGYSGQYQGKKVEQVNIQGEDLVPEGLLYTLSYMSLYDLLTMEKVCRSLRSRIKSDVLLWQRLHVELPMSNNLTDEVLLELASRSRGQLQCLSLVDCTRVTEAALEEIVLSNPRLVKLSLPGCSRITADAVIRMVERYTNQRFSGIATLKQLQVRNMDGFTKEHLQKLQKLLGVKTQEQSSARKPQYYHQKHHSSFQDDDRAIDVEECPICSHVRLVYDCTRERCQQKKGGSTYDCRACILCIVRCEACGRCITDNDYEETFSLDVLCSCCWLGLPKCSECNRSSNGSHVDHVIGTAETTVETQWSRFRFCA